VTEAETKGSDRGATEPLWRAASQEQRLAELTADDAELKEAPLRRDVRSLGIVLGRVLREQEGEALYAAVGEPRGLLIRRPEPDLPEHGVAPPSSSEAGGGRPAGPLAGPPVGGG